MSAGTPPPAAAETPDERPLASDRSPQPPVQGVARAVDAVLQSVELHGVRGPITRMPRTDKMASFYANAHRYRNASGDIVTLVRANALHDDPALRRQATLLAQSLPEGVEEVEEYTLAAALLAQREIAEMFGLDRGALCRMLKLRYDENRGDGIMNSHFLVYVAKFREKMALLRSRGFSEEDIIREVSGYVFHESLHNIDDEPLLQDSLGVPQCIDEYTTMTGELGYFLLTGHERSLASEEDFEAKGLTILRGQSSNDQKADHQKAVAVAYRLLLDALLAAFPEHADAGAVRPFSAACWAIRKRVPAEADAVLRAAVRSALVASATPECINAAEEAIRAEAG